MVTISNVFVREGKDNKAFVALELTGDIELVQSAETGRFYATSKRCSIPSTFSKELAKTLIGKQLPGKIEKVASIPYEYVVKETGEVLTLSHTYVYTPEEKREVPFLKAA
jgi:hypothetical protein